MKNVTVKLISAVIAAVMVLLSFPASVFAAADSSRFYILPNDNGGLTFSVGSYDKSSSESYMFLPNSVDASRVKVRYSGSYSSVTGSALIEWNSGAKYAVVDATNETSVTFGSRRLIFMRSSLPSMSVVLNDGENLDTIHSDKEAKIGAKVAIDGAGNAKHNLAATDIQIKTRGNTTFWFDKKPYQIKFDKKQDLFGMGKAKKWILLANYCDGTSVRTKVFFDLAEEIGLSNTPKSVFVDLYIDGDYKGVYQLIEKNEVGSARVDLQDESGVILEMEANNRLEAGDISFTTATTKKAFVYKDYVYDFEDTSTPERRARIAEIRSFVEGYVNRFERELYAADQNWDAISSMIDVDSFILYYFLNEFGEQVDCTLASTYFYIDGASDVLHCGPVWDFDRICAFNEDVPVNTDFVKNILDYTDVGSSLVNYRVEWFKELFRCPEFAARVNRLYSDVVKDAFDIDKVLGMIDSYQSELMPSLKMNHVKWVVFFNCSYTADELVSGSTADRIAYVTNSVKSILTNKKAYMDTAYDEYMPVITYTIYDSSGAKIKNYTGGCITPSANIASVGIKIDSPVFAGGVEYRLSAKGVNTGTFSDGEIASTDVGYINAIAANLTGYISNFYKVEYRIELGSKRWGQWRQMGNLSGRTSASGSESYKAQRIQMRIIKIAEPVFISGDIDCDGSVTAQDVVNIKTILAGGGESLINCDVDEDGSITALDVVRLKDLLAS